MKPLFTLLPLAPILLAAAGCAATGPTPARAPAGQAAPVAWPAFAAERPVQPEGLSVERGSIGRSSGGLEIPLYTISGPGETTPGQRPAVLLLAGADGRHTVGHDVARELIEALGGDDSAAEALADTTLYIIPMLNPDAFERGAFEPLDAAVPGGTLTPRDSDRDGRTDEDGPTDLNGDGVITQMRIENPEQRSGWNLRADKIIDPDEPRLLRDPKPEEGERATHTVLVEGRDADGDGKIAEDGIGGVDLNRNFPYLWPELAPDAGQWPLSEPESLALVEWMHERSNIYAVLVYGPGDTIVNIPEAGKFDQTRRVPTGIETDDKPAYERISKAFKEITGQTGAPTIGNEGSLHGWAYGHFGALTFSTPVWVRPDLVKKEEVKPEEGQGEAGEEQGDQPAEGAGDDQPEEPGATPAPQTITIAGRTIPLTPEGVRAAAAEAEAMTEAEREAIMAEFMALPAEVREKFTALMQGDAPEAGQPEVAEGDRPRAGRREAAGGGGKSEDAKWLAVSDDRGGQGFVEWTPFDHPDLGPVEIGGFRPGFKLNPPQDAIPGLVQQQAQFVTKLLEMAPKLVIEEPRAEALGAGIWRVSIQLRNDGELATRSAIGIKARRLTPIVMHIGADDDALISGSRIERTSSIAPGGIASHEWLVRRAAGEDLTITIRTAEWGEFEKTITLEEGR